MLLVMTIDLESLPNDVERLPGDVGGAAAVPAVPPYLD